ncbi:hypothetical protein DB345_04000 [Spartobacteria bacterium LR76]|nr:hypothetical protein DB345_04000 [Spartobacteria bacterium LR76]
MKTPSQFWTLFRFHVFASPWIWVMPLALSIQGFVGLNRYYGDLSMVFLLFGQQMWVPLVIAAWILLPEFFMSSMWMTAQTQQQAQAFGGEFLLTRAVDRENVFRCRGALYWTIICVTVAVWVIAAAFKPDITLQLNSQGGGAAKVSYYLDHIPGSFVEKTTDGGTTIKAPTGNIQIRVLMSVLMVVMSGVWLVFLPLISRLPQRKWIHWSIFILGIVALPLLSLRVRASLEPLLVFGLAHLPAMVVLAIGILLAAERFAETRLAKLEFM